MNTYTQKKLFTLAGAVLFFTATTQAAIIAHYTFDETTGTTASDSAGTNNGVITGGVTVGQTGISGKAYLFDGSTGYVDMGDSSFISSLVETGGAALNTFTISTWVKYTVSAQTKIVAFLGDDTKTDQYFALGQTNGKVVDWYRGPGGAAYNGGDYINNDTWHLLTTTISPTEKRTYVDGSLLNTETVTYGTIAGANNFEIGRLGRSNVADYFNGLIDDVQVYNTTLSASDVSYLFANPGTAIPEPSAFAALLGLGSLALVLRRRR